MLGLAAFLWARAALAGSTQELFRIDRSTNRNAVVYAARVATDGEIERANPVTAYWMMNENGGKREELTFMERSLAYGFTTSEDEAGVLLKLAAFDQRTLRLVRRGSRYLATVRIAGKIAVLRRIWVQADESLLGPQVRYIELEGHESSTGERLTERITRDARSARRPR